MKHDLVNRKSVFNRSKLDQYLKVGESNLDDSITSDHSIIQLPGNMDSMLKSG